MNHYENKALLFAEQHGIIDYDVKENIMTWENVHYEPYKNVYLSNLNLNTMKENRKLINRVA